MGELGWTLERWEDATFTELHYASDGYWRNWERFAAVPMREICYTQIAGNPNIKNGSKPHSAKEYMRLSIDGETKKIEKPTDEEIKQAREGILNGKKT